MTDVTRPAEHAAVVTPHNTNTLKDALGIGGDGVTRGVYVANSGDLEVVLAGSGTVIYRNLAAGVIHPIRAKIIKVDGTTINTAGDIIAHW